MRQPGSHLLAEQLRSIDQMDEGDVAFSVYEKRLTCAASFRKEEKRSLTLIEFKLAFFQKSLPRGVQLNLTQLQMRRRKLQ